MAAPAGNQNAAKGRDWRDAIRRAVAKRGDANYLRGLDVLADQFVEAVSKGDLNAFKELGDRLDGKPAQAIVGGDEDDPAVKVAATITVTHVKADAT